jgi:hypothetical protein
MAVESDQAASATPRVYEKTGGISTRVVAGAIASAEVVGVPGVVIPGIEEKSETLARHGWLLLLEDEPDGKVTLYLADEDSREILKSALGTDFEDAWLELGIGTTPPSQELRREREERRKDDAL